MNCSIVTVAWRHECVYTSSYLYRQGTIKIQESMQATRSFSSPGSHGKMVAGDNVTGTLKFSGAADELASRVKTSLAKDEV